MKRILNVGCGNEIYGSDFVDVYPLRKEVIKCNVSEEKLPYKNNTFGEVYSKNLLEHIPNPLHVINEMKRVLKSKGKIFLITDNAGFLLFHLPIRKNNYLEHNSNFPRAGKEDRHYFLFTPLHLTNLLEKAGGFEQIKVRYNYYSSRKFVKIARHLLKSRVLRKIATPHLIVEAIKT